MKIKEVRAKLDGYDDEFDFSIGNIVDILVGDKTNLVCNENSVKTDAAMFTESELEDFDPNEHLSASEELRKEVEKRVASLKKKDIAATFDDLNLKGEFADDFADAYAAYSADDGEMVTLLDLFGDIEIPWVMTQGSMPEEKACALLSYILNQKKIAFYYKD